MRGLWKFSLELEDVQFRQISRERKKIDAAVHLEQPLESSVWEMVKEHVLTVWIALLITFQVLSNKIKRKWWIGGKFQSQNGHYFPWKFNSEVSVLFLLRIAIDWSDALKIINLKEVWWFDYLIHIDGYALTEVIIA